MTEAQLMAAGYQLEWGTVGEYKPAIYVRRAGQMVWQAACLVPKGARNDATAALSGAREVLLDMLPDWLTA